MAYWSTRQVAKLLRITVSKLSRMVWDGSIDAPTKAPSGNYLWAEEDIIKAGWVICRKDISSEIHHGATTHVR